MSDLYETLGVAKDAPREAVRRAFRKRAQAAHPDRGGSREAWGALVRARDVLCDDERRGRYDRTGEAEDDPIADNLEANALDWAMKSVDEAIMSVANRGLDPVKDDILERARRSVQGNLDKNGAMQAQLREGAGKYRALAQRFKKRGRGDNRLWRLMEGKASDLERGAERNEDLARPLRRALEILAEYEFEVDRSAPSQPGMGGMFFVQNGIV